MKFSEVIESFWKASEEAMYIDCNDHNWSRTVQFEYGSIQIEK